jgi:hypothetical protein
VAAVPSGLSPTPPIIIIIISPKYDCSLFVNLTDAGNANIGIIIPEGKRLLVNLDVDESIILK